MPTPGSTTTISRRSRRRAHLGRVQHLRDVDVGCAFGRRLYLRREPVFPRIDRMGSAARDGGRHHHRLFPDEPDRAAVAEIRHAVSGGGADVVRRDGRQYRGRPARHCRYRLVRRADLLRVQGRAGAGAGILSRRRGVDAFRFCRPYGARLGQLSVHVVVSASDLPQRHGDDPQVHRFLRPGRLRRDVCARDLDPGADRHVQPVAAAKSASRRLGARAYGERGDVDRGLFRGAAA